MENSGRGTTWTSKEIRCLIEIWSEDFITTQLSSTHKNSNIYSVFSQRLKDKGFVRSTEQCRIKVKKLRAEYVNVRDALKKTGSDGLERDRFPWYDDLNKILGGTPVVDPVDVVESHQSPPASTADQQSPSRAAASDLDPASTETTFEDSTCTSEASVSGTCEESTSGERLPIPGSQACKRKSRSCRADDNLHEYMAANKRMMDEMFAAEQRHLAQEADNFERMRQAQREDEERRFQALLAQQQATTQMFAQLMGNFISALHPGVASSWSTTPPATPSAWSMPHQHQPPYPAAQSLMNPPPHPTLQMNPPPHPSPQLQMNLPHQQQKENDIPSTSSFLQDLHSQIDYSNL